MAKKNHPTSIEKGGIYIFHGHVAVFFGGHVSFLFHFFCSGDSSYITRQKSHWIESQKGQSTWVQTFLEKNVTNMSHNNMGFSPKLSKQLMERLVVVFRFPGPSFIGPRNFLPSSYGR